MWGPRAEPRNFAPLTSRPPGMRNRHVSLCAIGPAANHPRLSFRPRRRDHPDRQGPRPGLEAGLRRIPPDPRATCLRPYARLRRLRRRQAPHRRRPLVPRIPPHHRSGRGRGGHGRAQGPPVPRPHPPARRPDLRWDRSLRPLGSGGRAQGRRRLLQQAHQRCPASGKAGWTF